MKHSPTEMALAADGTLFVNVTGWPATKRKGRRVFRGYSLRHSELGTLLSSPLDSLSGIALGCDGRIYGDEARVDARTRRGRRAFVGVALSRSERALAAEELARIALNITVAVLNEGRGGSSTKKTLNTETP